MSASRPPIAVKLLLPVVALVLSLIALGVGAVWTASANGTLTAALTSQTGTAADVYGSQSAIVASSALLSAGIIGLVVSLAALGILIGFGALSRPAEASIDEAYAEEYAGGEFEGPTVAVPAAAAPGTVAGPAAATATPAAAATEEPVVLSSSATDAPDVSATPTEVPEPAGSAEEAAADVRAAEAPATGASATEALAEPAPEPGDGDRRA